MTAPSGPQMPVVITQTSTPTPMNTAHFPPAQPPTTYREMETRSDGYGYDQSSSQPNKY